MYALDLQAVSPRDGSHLNILPTCFPRSPSIPSLLEILRPPSLGSLVATRSLLQIEAIVIEHLDTSYEPMHNNIHRSLRLYSLVQATITRTRTQLSYLCCHGAQPDSTIREFPAPVRFLMKGTVSEFLCSRFTCRVACCARRPPVTMNIRRLPTPLSSSSCDTTDCLLINRSNQE
jgi:hypothetical protein